MLRYPLIVILVWLGCSSSVSVRPGAEQYPNFKSFIAAEQERLGELYVKPGCKDSAQELARHFIFDVISDSMHSYWQGTDWEFYGTSETPGKGSIACGYFVTTLLRDAGFKLNRVALAKCASETMIKSLVQPQHIKRYPNLNFEKFCSDVSKAGDALYIVGLDFHTGFIVCKDKKVYFLHSNYTSVVMKENARESEVLKSNRYLVIGCITADNKLLRNWLKNEQAGS